MMLTGGLGDDKLETALDVVSRRLQPLSLPAPTLSIVAHIEVGSVRG
jgi:hypothetical protein